MKPYFSGSCSHYVNLLKCSVVSLGRSGCNSLLYQNRFLIRKRYNKTPYELLHDRKSNLSFLHVFGALCYPNNDSEDQGLMPQPLSPTPNVPPTKDDWDVLFQPMFDEFFKLPPSVDHPVPSVAAEEPVVSTGIPSDSRKLTP
ncbi:hypothetical protein Tco_0076306 [Tanacetum coccineum]